ncbi:MAG: GntR family transcriptional regulator [Candidatus Dormibacteraeota bacterium]|nr:GntR family transcriptional regulator [Candidatus Dormibacteraeota bacterium]
MPTEVRDAGRRGARGGAANGVAVAPPDAIHSLSQDAYRRIREKIISLELTPGAVVEEARLRRELDIGRTPIREALQRLADESLVRSVPHRGTFVTEVNISDLARITEVRVVLEAQAAGLAAERATAADKEAMTELQEVLATGGATDQRELMRLDRQVHAQIHRAARNHFLESTLERYYSLSLRLWFLVLDREVRLRDAVDEHVELLRAVVAGDRAGAEAIMRRHVIGFEREIRKVLAEA